MIKWRVKKAEPAVSTAGAAGMESTTSPTFGLFETRYTLSNASALCLLAELSVWDHDPLLRSGQRGMSIGPTNIEKKQRRWILGLLSFALVGQLTTSAWAWGRLGHKVIHLPVV